MGGWWAADAKDLLIFSFAPFAVVEDEAVKTNVTVTRSSVNAAYLIHNLGPGLSLEFAVGYAPEMLAFRYLWGIAPVFHATEGDGRETNGVQRFKGLPYSRLMIQDPSKSEVHRSNSCDGDTAFVVNAKPYFALVRYDYCRQAR